jgi:V/A-type H+-transporting ATPase subunit E
MSDKLEKLTQQIYEEGVAKAKGQARTILEHAEEEKKKLLRAAREEAEDIVAMARREADELRKKVESELRMASVQALALLRQKITELICEKVGKSSVDGIFDDMDFLKKILEVVMKEWVASHCARGQDFYLKLPMQVQKDIKEYFFEKGKKELNSGLRIEFDEQIKSGFVIVPKDGAYRIGFTEDDFKALVQYFLRPRMKKFLFGEHEGK